MPTAQLVELAEAITTTLAAASFATGVFIPVRSYADWNDTLDELNEDLQVDVVPVGHDIAELEARESMKYESGVDVAVRKRFGTASQNASTGRIELAEIDDLVLLVEQIHELFCKEAVTSATIDASWLDTTIRATYIREHLREHRQFTGIVRIRYRLSKATA